jgi:hemolysin III
VSELAGSSPERLKLGPIDNPVRGALHGTAAAAALALSGWLVSTDSPPPYPVAFALFSVPQAALYLTSSLYHTVPWRPAAKVRMQRLDHSMIFLTVAGSVSAIVLLGLDGPLRVALIAAAWVIAIGGVTHKMLAHGADQRISVPIQFALSLLAIPALPRFVERFPGPPTVLLVAGAAFFAVGALCFVTRTPRLWPRVFSFHEVFHVCTVVGSGAHCLLFVRYLWQVG